MWQNLRLETFASLLESIVIFKIAFDSFFFPLYGYRLGLIFLLLFLHISFNRILCDPLHSSYLIDINHHATYIQKPIFRVFNKLE